MPVGCHVVDGVITVLTDSGWRHNLVEPRVDRPPTREELTDVVRRSGLVAVRLQPV